MAGYRNAVNTYDFGGRVAVVTGGASGIGAATVELQRTCGARVAVLDSNVDGLRDDVLGIRGDVTRSSEADTAVKRVESDLGKLDLATVATVSDAGCPVHIDSDPAPAQPSRRSPGRPRS
jgi:NAD(P)-dependent dehydrogenase (short-subunit alcohol dehydrogenase family)